MCLDPTLDCSYMASIWPPPWRAFTVYQSMMQIWPMSSQAVFQIAWGGGQLSAWVLGFIENRHPESGWQAGCPPSEHKSLRTWWEQGETNECKHRKNEVAYLGSPWATRLILSFTVCQVSDSVSGTWLQRYRRDCCHHNLALAFMELASLLTAVLQNWRTRSSEY